MSACTYPTLVAGGVYVSPDGTRRVTVLSVDHVGSAKVRLEDKTETFWHPIMFRDWKQVAGGVSQEWAKWFVWKDEAES